ncbi:MAG TPA: hypothetical protein IAB44_12275 [Candidatus Limivivens intestinipullorum]|uniref:Uncharacterized protein n=1 Tax=Candidatus Limivivens intestinipullorum TaxID=2840858 RepID=A0A9D1EV96_9FIRM|nr:hypothetical protein [Candidatus Limivivens intestinipullorum]
MDSPFFGGCVGTSLIRLKIQNNKVDRFIIAEKFGKIDLYFEKFKKPRQAAGIKFAAQQSCGVFGLRSASVGAKQVRWYIAHLISRKNFREIAISEIGVYDKIITVQPRPAHMLRGP